MIEANGFILLPDETEDFDLAWIATEQEASEQTVWQMLKAVDPTFTINSERDFQARNARAYEVELLVAPSRAGTLSGRDQPRPIPLPEQEWLLLGRPVDQVIGCRDGSSEERPVGNECGSTLRSTGSQYHEKTNTQQQTTCRY